MISLIKWNLKKNHTHELVCNRNRVKDVENKLVVTKGERGREIDWEIGIDIYKLLLLLLLLLSRFSRVRLCATP